MLVILSLSIATVAMGITGLSLVSPVFAGGDHHDHGEKKCKNNDDNNCNDTHKTQKIKAKNDCEIENENKDHSKDNTNDNELSCVNEAQNLKDAEHRLTFSLLDGTDAPSRVIKPKGCIRAVIIVTAHHFFGQS